MDELEPKEQSIGSGTPPKSGKITLQQAVDFGEYNPKYLQNFAEWHSLTTHIQWELIRKALNIRRRQLVTQYATLNNVLDLRDKPYVRQAIKNVERQIEHLEKDKESLYVEYSNKM